MYTINEIAKITGLSVHTIRYYDREGLIPNLARTKSGARQFSEDDLEWIKLICCLKNSGMALQDIRTFMKLCLCGAKTCEQRKQLLLVHKEHILDQIQNLEKSLETINFKIDHYREIGIFHIDQQKKTC